MGVVDSLLGCSGRGAKLSAEVQKTWIYGRSAQLVKHKANFTLTSIFIKNLSTAVELAVALEYTKVVAFTGSPKGCERGQHATERDHCLNPASSAPFTGYTDSSQTH
jgi:hypothetical protein